MAKIRYESWDPKADALEVIAQATDICRDYRSQGYDLTLRQLYYQFVARGLIPNTNQSYKRLGSIVNKARMAGLLDWAYIVDRTRNIAGIGSFGTPDEYIRGIADYFTVDHWVDQPYYVEVWVEKEALAGVVQRAANRFDVPYFSCRGYVSQSELWGAGRRIGRQLDQGKSVLILHLGDHDPSGIDMTRDIRERLELFTTTDFYEDNAGGIYLDEGDEDDEGNITRSGVEAVKRAMAERTLFPDDDPIEIRRIALNMDQVLQYNPPPNPAKMTDSRVAGYIEQHGRQSWELDALDPSTLTDLIALHIDEVVDPELWDEHDEIQNRERARLSYVADRWQTIAAEYDDLQED